MWSLEDSGTRGCSSLASPWRLAEDSAAAEGSQETDDTPLHSVPVSVPLAVSAPLRGHVNITQSRSGAKLGDIWGRQRPVCL